MLRLCPVHWQRLVNEIDRAGLRPLCSPEACQDMLMNEILGHPMTADGYDPLIYALGVINISFVHLYGDNALAYLLNVCPICHLLKLHTTSCHTPGCTTEQQLEQWPASAVGIACAKLDELMKKG